MSGKPVANRFGECSVAVRIMHRDVGNPRRNDILRELCASLVEMDLEFSIILDRHKSSLDTSLRSWISGEEEGTTHVMVLEDDVFLHSQFAIIMQMAITSRSDSVISMFSMSRRIKKLYKENVTNWLEVPTCSWNQCWVIPSHLISEINGFIARYGITQHCYDCCLSAWSLINHRKIYVLIPNPVEHAGYKESMIGHGPKLGGMTRSSGFFVDSLEQYRYLNSSPAKMAGLRIWNYGNEVDLGLLESDRMIKISRNGKMRVLEQAPIIIMN